MPRDQENRFSILSVIWYPFLFAFIFGALSTGGYLLIGKETKSTNTPIKKESSTQTATDYAKDAKNFLDLLKKGSKDLAYESVSKEFKEAMPYDKFLQFVADYPIITTFDHYEAEAATQEETDMLVTIVLHPKSGNASLPVHFTLVSEKGDWKILGFVINQPSVSPDLRDLDAVNNLKTIVLNFLAKLREGKIEDAYKGFTSEVFQTGTSLGSFISYTNEKPFFRSETSADVVDGHVDGGRGYLKVALNVDKDKIPVDFSLSLGKDGWKIDGIYLLTPPEPATPGEAEKGHIDILDGTIGLDLGPDGGIKEPVKEISSKVKTIHLSLLVDTSAVGIPLNVSLIHLPTGIATSPLSTTIPKQGLTRLSFSYSTPPSGWPLGKYVMKVSSGDEIREYNFLIND